MPSDYLLAKLAIVKQFTCFGIKESVLLILVA
jgi:hypothetical protein